MCSAGVAMDNFRQYLCIILLTKYLFEVTSKDNTTALF